MCEGASKQTPGLKIQPRRDRAPPRFEVPGSATEMGCYHVQGTLLYCPNQRTMMEMFCLTSGTHLSTDT